MPHTFKPNLHPAEATIAVGGCLTRIFGSCIWLAVWGGTSALVWNAIGTRLWRAVVLLPLLVLFPVGLITLLVAVKKMESLMARKR